MRKFALFLLFSSLILLLIACQPTTTSPDSSEPALDPAIEIEAASPKPPTESAPTEEPAPTETAVLEETTPPTPSKIPEFTAEPLPTISLEEVPMTDIPSNAIELLPENYPNAVNIAVQDLAQRLGVDESEIEVVYVAAVIWPDASLGCPHPDMVYTQVQKDGLLVRLEVDGEIYSYHSGGAREIFLCESPAKGMKPNEDLLPPPGDMDT